MQKTQVLKLIFKNFVDSTGQYTRITTFMKDMKIERMERIEEELNAEIQSNAL